MSERISLFLDNGDGAEFDKALRVPGILRDDGYVRFYTKDKATISGDPGILMSFMVELPDGTTRPVQTVMTVRLFLTAMRALEMKYPNL